MYRGEIKGSYVLLGRTQAGPDRAVKQEQEQKILATTYKPLSESQYCPVLPNNSRNWKGRDPKEVCFFFNEVVR